MIKIITANDVLPLRSMVLRNNSDLEVCRFVEDTYSGVVHVGYFDDEKLVCVATCFPQNCASIAGTGYQLRGMATSPEYTGKGYGVALLTFLNEYVKQNKGQYIWCNARKSAVRFYEKSAYKIISEEFHVDGIGPHFKMAILL